jgi:putative ABC transport system ATP-binding protein
MIQMKNLSKTYMGKDGTSVEALKDINLEINAGEFVLFEGVSGSGKSTLLHIIASLLKPTEGLVAVQGENIASLSDYHASIYRRDKVAYITQSFHLLNELSVEDNLLAPLVLKNLSPSKLNAVRLKALAMANIAHKAKEKVSNLSGGEKQRCIIARAIANNADIILCDEPTANLDKENSLNFINIMQKLKSEGKTIIIATHDPLFQSLPFIDRRLKIKDGQLG